MKKISKNLVWVFVIGIIVANILVFLNGMALGDQISGYEKSISRLKDENTDLEKKVYQSQSFTYAALMAKAMSFTKKSQPIYVDNLLYAKN